MALESNEAGAVHARFIPTDHLSDRSTAEFVACHRLAAAELPAHRLRALLEAGGGIPTATIALPESEWRTPTVGLTEKQIGRLRDALHAPLDPRLLDRARHSATYAITYRDISYPANLLPLHDVPPIFFVRGALLESDRFSIAIVGTRRATNYGREQAARFARVFAENGLSLISGGAAGIDAAAHNGALTAGGRTIAVLGCGVDIVYPVENRALFTRIAAEGQGALLSEFPMGTRPEPWRFPTRNRIIAGIARASLLIETPDASGALGTARCAVEYGRDVYVVPGPVDTGRSRGGHRLILDGAILADAPEDVLESLGVTIAAQEPAPRMAPVSAATRTAVPKPAPPPPAPAPVPIDLPPNEAALLTALDATPRHLDEAAQQAKLSAPQATVAATLLEMKTLIRRHPGNLFTRI